MLSALTTRDGRSYKAYFSRFYLVGLHFSPLAISGRTFSKPEEVCGSHGRPCASSTHHCRVHGKRPRHGQYINVSLINCLSYTYNVSSRYTYVHCVYLLYLRVLATAAHLLFYQWCAAKAIYPSSVNISSDYVAVAQWRSGRALDLRSLDRGFDYNRGKTA